MKLLNKNITTTPTTLAAVAVITVIGGIVTSLLSTTIVAAYAEHDVTKEKSHGKAWPKTAFYIPENAEGLTGLTIASCDSPEQCKEVNGTPSANLAAKLFCEEISGEKCKKLKEFPGSP